MTRQFALLASIATALFMTNVNVYADGLPDNAAGTAPIEIEHLLEFVGSSACVFKRNGGRHDATEAEAHLRMKYGKGKRHVETAEQFISRIASKSSWSGRTYTVDCPGEGTQPSGQWLTEELRRYRATR